MISRLFDQVDEINQLGQIFQARSSNIFIKLCDAFTFKISIDFLPLQTWHGKREPRGISYTTMRQYVVLVPLVDQWPPDKTQNHMQSQILITTKGKVRRPRSIGVTSNAKQKPPLIPPKRWRKAKCHFSGTVAPASSPKSSLMSKASCLLPSD